MKTKRVLVFGGTTEGRIIGEHLYKNNLDFTLSVATNAGVTALNKIPSNFIINGRLNSGEMEVLFPKYSMIIDATHPYASEVTENIKVACEKTNIKYIRVLRNSSQYKNSETVKYFNDNSEAADFLNNVDGNILLAIGSKNVQDFTSINNYENRVYIRMLPLPNELQKCLDLGFKSSNIICIQGCFSKEYNMEILKMINAKYMVTKDSGDIGGFNNKIEASKELNIVSLVINRPKEEEGYTLNETLKLIEVHFKNNIRKRFPIFIDLWDKVVIIVGGGKVAERRVKKLLNFTNNIRVISPEITSELRKIVVNKNITWEKREYVNGDLKGASIAIASTNNLEVNNKVFKEAESLNIYCSVANSKELSSFWFPGIVETENFVLGIVSNNGDHKSVKNAVVKINELKFERI